MFAYIEERRSEAAGTGSVRLPRHLLFKAPPDIVLFLLFLLLPSLWCMSNFALLKCLVPITASILAAGLILVMMVDQKNPSAWQLEKSQIWPFAYNLTTSGLSGSPSSDGEHQWSITSRGRRLHAFSWLALPSTHTRDEFHRVLWCCLRSSVEEWR